MAAILTARAWFELAYVDLLGMMGFRAIQRAVTGTPISPVEAGGYSVAEITQAVNGACMWYFKTPRCLQRSAVITRMLRRHGLPAEMLVGYQMPPLRAHAWVSVAGMIATFEEQDSAKYCVLDRW